MGDSLTPLQKVQVSISDGWTWGGEVLTETAGPPIEYQVSAIDGIKWGDASSVEGEFGGSLTDGWTFGDLATTQLIDYTHEETDGVVWGDNTVGSLGDIYLESRVDGWVWGDEAFFADVGGLIYQDAYLLHRLTMKSDLNHELEIDEVEVTHRLTMKSELK